LENPGLGRQGARQMVKMDIVMEMVTGRAVDKDIERPQVDRYVIRPDFWGKMQKHCPNCDTWICLSTRRRIEKSALPK
jgi:hypothetical protein